ncbi:MAG: hypothetical protein ACRDOL_34830, partial [Streptosporangiaceae bacterium]
ARAVAAEADRQQAASKAARKAARRGKREAAERAEVQRLVRERLQLARRFSETSAGPALREASNADLGFAAAAALGSNPAGAPAARPVVEMAVQPQALSPGDLAVAAVAGSAGQSPFWAGQASGDSPFWKAAAGA